MGPVSKNTLANRPPAGLRLIHDVEWRANPDLVSYEEAVAEMERRVDAIRKNAAPEMVWLLEHPPLYTAGTSARDGDLLDSGPFPVYRSGRGGQYTYHGPGQRVAYVMLDLKRRNPDVRCFVHNLEEWVIQALASFNVRGERRSGRVGIWIARGGGREDKIAAIGVRVRRSEEQTSELQSLMRSTYAVLCWKTTKHRDNLPPTLEKPT